ncbi:MAG: zinc ribbon domain-containing protein [Nitrospirae bacterium]|nr:zinc ribbon domain-containing protein [Nitrospirota bacterium]
MKKSTKVTLGILNVLPFVYIPVFFIVMMSMVPHHAGGGGAQQPPDGKFFVLFGVHFLMVLLSFGLTIYYVVHLFTSKLLPDGKKALWAVLLLLGNLLVFPFYWYLYIWCEPKPMPAQENGVLFCHKCGFKNDPNSFRCTDCGTVLYHPECTGQAAGQYDGVSTVIPYRNKPALVAYYLGVFSIIPVLGIFLGIAAFVLGLKGRRNAIDNPERKGIVHAWIGILAGGFFGFGYLVATIVIAVKMMGS